MQTQPFPEASTINRIIACKKLMTDLNACIVEVACSHATMNGLWKKWAECEKKVIRTYDIESVSDK